MGYDDKNDADKLKDYAENQAWNEFYDSGKIDDYERFVEIKEDLEDSRKNEQENEND